MYNVNPQKTGLIFSNEDLQMIVFKIYTFLRAELR